MTDTSTVETRTVTVDFTVAFDRDKAPGHVRASVEHVEAEYGPHVVTDLIAGAVRDALQSTGLPAINDGRTYLTVDLA